jgi:hypothetical protein
VPVLGFVKAVEASRPVGDVLFDLISLDQEIHPEDLLAKVPLIQSGFQDGS